MSNIKKNPSCDIMDVVMKAVLRLPVLAVLLGLLLLRAAPAGAETLTCNNLTALPATISTSGHYCLNQNFTQAFDSVAININAGNVVLDCNKHTIINTGVTPATGVFVTNKNSVTVRGCKLQHFTRGIAIFETAANGSRNNVVENNEVRKSLLAGIQVAGNSNTIQGNLVTENLGSQTAYTYGILVSSFDGTGAGNTVRGNIVTNIAPEVPVRIIGIYLLDVQNTVVQGNTVSAMYPPADLFAYGIVASASVSGTLVRDNSVLSATGLPSAGGGGIPYGGTNSDGIRFDGTPTGANHNVCRDNVVGHFVFNDINAQTTNTGCIKASNTEF